MKYISKIIIALIFPLIIGGCSEDYLETESGTNVSAGKIENSIQGNEAIMNGVYRKLFESYAEDPASQGILSLTWRYDMRCEDIAFKRTSWGNFMDAKLWYAGKDWSTTHQNWSFYYNVILNCNKVLDNVDNFKNEANYKNIKGQAVTMRAWAYFYLARLYQQTYKGNEDKLCVILRKTGNYEPLPRSTVKECYEFIETELLKAVTLLDGVSRKHKSHVNKNVAQGLLARVYLTQENWGKAAEYAEKARENNPLMAAKEYTTGFNNIKNEEWIWGIEILTDEAKGWRSHYTVITTNVLADGTELNYNKYDMYYAINEELYAKIDNNDIRKTLFNPTDKRFPYLHSKWKIKENFTGDFALMRGAEMYLIEAEAKSHIAGKEAEAKNLLKVLRESRAIDIALVPNITATGKDLTDEILLERRIELWGEGFRWFDIKRTTGKMIRNENQFLNPKYNSGLNTGMMYINPGSSLWAMQIPIKEFESNTALNPNTDQNPKPPRGL